MSAALCRRAAHHALAAAAALEQYADACRALGYDLKEREAMREITALRAAAEQHDRCAASYERARTAAQEADAICAFETGTY